MRHATKRAAADRPEPAVPGRLEGKAALVALGEDGIGRAVAVAFAREGADVAIVYFNDHRNAEETRQRVLLEGRRCVLLAGDATKEWFCRFAVRKVMSALGRLDILVNDAGKQRPGPDQRGAGAPKIEHAFRNNLLSMFNLTRAAAPRIADGGVIINTTVTPASPHDSAPLTDYVAAMRKATVAFTRSLAAALRRRRIGVNAVDPEVAPDGLEHPNGGEVAPRYVSLAARDRTFVTGQALQPVARRSSRQL
jgi:NAD(P)-dependent dehydrogenase (short-subunit alcohol dehydrogenase family)